MDDHDKGLAHDLDTLGRRRVLLGAAGLAATTLLTVWGCGGGGDSTGQAGSASSSGSSSGSSGGSGSTSTGTCAVSAEETQGPFPADGSNTINGTVSNALALTGIVRSDIRSSFGSLSGTAAGVPTTLTLTLVNVNDSCAVLSGYAIYVWHCDRDGEYSLYGVTDQNYLRGVQETDASGTVTFTTIFPACYSGRMPHIHIEVYRSETTATSYTNKLKTTQLAFPVDVCETIYSTAAGYSQSVTNLAQISFATDMVFSDGTATEMSTVTGSVADGYTVSLQVGISV
ncbi:intradiol ring-cleavage dioxygenase [Scleromatobacter humisilvae]|uniref:Intradiol ring-cleavage dioxygenase n=1 Tax=Scleromatobacter humisilvae TaxID=2897159 RepID=A0A9X2BYM6_9BURK|nr:intradiol ring-cleavage dioxygenase [Scleromatobacter humisilvae]MCK9685532.1 intradiol ring-cleavage dioxygenase [Scleromatobacter humisilvae]